MEDAFRHIANRDFRQASESVAGKDNQIKLLIFSDLANIIGYIADEHTSGQVCMSSMS